MSENVFDFNKSFTQKQVEEEIKFLPENVKALAKKAFNCEKEKDYEGARQACKQVLEINSDKAVNSVKVLLSRVYYEILMDDIEGENDKYNQDVEEYFEFIDTLNMNEVLQEYMVETMAKLCENIESDWFRPLFIKFVKTVEEKKYLKDERYNKTIISAYMSAEAASFYDDLRVKRIVKGFVKSAYMCEFAMADEESERIKDSMMLDNLTYVYYMCSYYEDNKVELNNLKEVYPHCYSLVEKQLEEIENDPQKVKEETLEKLMKYVSAGIAKPQLAIAMDKAYENVLADNDKAFVVHNGRGTYKRSYSKVGRNDLCPCGSGLKYKQCCGKNA